MKFLISIVLLIFSHIATANNSCEKEMSNVISMVDFLNEKPLFEAKGLLASASFNHLFQEILRENQIKSTGNAYNRDEVVKITFESDETQTTINVAGKPEFHVTSIRGTGHFRTTHNGFNFRQVVKKENKKYLQILILKDIPGSDEKLLTLSEDGLNVRTPLKLYQVKLGPRRNL